MREGHFNSSACKSQCAISQHQPSVKTIPFLMKRNTFFSPGTKLCNFLHNDIKIVRQDY